MKNIFKIVIFLAIVIVVLSLLLIWPKQKSQISQVCFKQNCFQVEIADTLLEQEKGLMFRDNLEKDRGMLFVFKEEGDYSFWMKNTLIPLDIIWINQNQEIVFIKENAQPCQQDDCPVINPNQKAKYILELNGGTVKSINLKVGDKMTFNLTNS